MRVTLIVGSMSVLLACSGKVSSGGQCGDGTLDAGEDCDGADLGGNDCTSLSFTGGTLACRADCTFNDSACQTVVCGDAVGQGLEQCDGADLRGETCVSAGYSGGALACTGACRFDFSACTGPGPQCGNGNVEGLEECDGANLNGATCQNLGYGTGQLSCRIDCTIEPSACSNIAADPLSDATGCAGVYNIDQVLSYYLTLPAGDWSAIKADDPMTGADVVKGAEFSCEGEAPIVVGVRRKRAGGTNKIGVKIDVNYFIATQRHYGLKNLVFDNSVGCCVADEGDLDAIIREYTAWRMMRFGGVVSSRTVFANLYVNNELLGVYINIEVVDKVFLADRYGDDSGWLYKKSGGNGDGLKTHETDGLAGANPYDDYFCFWPGGAGGQPTCTAPADLATSLPQNLQIEQMLRFGAVNAMIANTDSPIFKNNNFYIYDWSGRRLYLPWDLDTCLTQTTYSVFTGRGSGGEIPDYVNVLFSNWEGTYDQIITDLLADKLSVASVHAELDRVVTVAGAAMAADPYAQGDAASAVTTFKNYWTNRHANVETEVQAR